MTSNFSIDVTVDDYRYTMTDAGTVALYRKGEPWQRDGQGDGLLMALAAEVQHLRSNTGTVPAEIAEARAEIELFANDPADGPVNGISKRHLRKWLAALSTVAAGAVVAWRWRSTKGGWHGEWQHTGNYRDVENKLPSHYVVEELRVGASGNIAALKPLEWEDWTTRGRVYSGTSKRLIAERAMTPFNAYFLEHDENDGTWWATDGLLGDEVAGPLAEDWQAREAVEALFSAKVRECLA